MEVIESEADFHAAKTDLHEALQHLISGKNRVVSLEELERNMEKIISRHENQPS
ncbi:MAG: hypothetical protein JJU35_10675 [Balneolales bacterium]|nr:hypothetical protein [Balneolales bacterium]